MTAGSEQAGIRTEKVLQVGDVAAGVGAPQLAVDARLKDNAGRSGLVGAVLARHVGARGAGEVVSAVLLARRAGRNKEGRGRAGQGRGSDESKRGQPHAGLLSEGQQVVKGGPRKKEKKKNKEKEKKKGEKEKGRTETIKTKQILAASNGTDHTGGEGEEAKHAAVKSFGSSSDRLQSFSTFRWSHNKVELVQPAERNLLKGTQPGWSVATGGDGGV